MRGRGGQGVGEELQGQVSRSIAYAAARYGHVLMPTNVTAPALEVPARRQRRSRASGEGG